MAFAVTNCQYMCEGAELSENNDGQISYTVKFLIETVDAQLVDPLTVGRAAHTPPPGSIPFPLRGDAFSWNGAVIDLSSFCKRRSVKRASKDNWNLWEAVAYYEPLSASETQSRYSQQSPENWEPEAWITWNERQVLVTEGVCLTDLSHIDIGLNSSDPAASVPICNAAGQQTIDPLTDTRYFPILNIRRYYQSRNDIDALNVAFQGTMNDGLFAGGVAKTWKYLVTKAEKARQKTIFVGTPVATPQLITYVPGVTTFELKYDLHTRRIVNNGMQALRKDESNQYIPITGGATPDLFPILTKAQDDGEKDTQITEPVNLEPDGTFAGGTNPNIIEWDTLNAVDYSGFSSGAVWV